MKEDSLAFAEKRIKNLKKEYGYDELLPIDCCLTCKNVICEPEQSPECFLLRDDNYCVSDVSPLGLCKKFEPTIK
jgi:hypothetical protein